MEVHGRIAGSSNATLLVTCSLQEQELLAVYKPFKGERPLWDFPGGLFRREVAAYVLSETLGWGLVPETVERTEGPFGEGSVQRFVHEDGTSHYFTLRDEPKWHPVLMRLAAFDVVANNADRKSGHVLLAEDRLWAIDNGLCFNREDKLRTVIWDFGGEPLGAGVEEDLARLAREGPPAGLAELLEPSELAATMDRVAWLLSLAPPRTRRRRGDGPVSLAAGMSPSRTERRGLDLETEGLQLGDHLLGHDLAPAGGQGRAVGRAYVDGLSRSIGDECRVPPCAVPSDRAALNTSRVDVSSPPAVGPRRSRRTSVR